MITFNREGAKVKIYIEHGIFGNESSFELEIVQSQDYQAELLREALRNHMLSKLKAIKEEAYNEGWKDAKGKKSPKRTYFYGSWKY